MNRCAPGFSISKSIDGFLKFKTAEGLSPKTIISYEHTLTHWLEHIGDQPVEEVTSADLTDYMAWIRTDYNPIRFTGNTDPYPQNPSATYGLLFCHSLPG